MKTEDALIFSASYKKAIQFRKSARLNQVSELEKLFNEAYLNEKEPSRGYTALHFAARFNALEAVGWLLAKNVDITVLDNEAWNSKMHAHDTGHTEIVAV